MATHGGQSALYVEGLKDFRRELLQVDKGLTKEMKKAHQKIANHTQGAARKNATAASGPFADRYADARMAIKSFSSVRDAAIGVSRSGRIPHAQATFWGMSGRTGWYAAEKYAASTGQQHPEWVGNRWDAGVPGQGPHVLNYTVAEERPQIIEQYGEAMDALFAKAFPDPTI